MEQLFTILAYAMVTLAAAAMILWLVGIVLKALTWVVRQVSQLGRDPDNQPSAERLQP
jgi:hypothetical protein